MKLILINNNPEFEIAFKNYVEEWRNEKMNPNEDYFGMYKSVFDDYQKSIDHLISLRESQRIEEKKPYVRFYWFMNNLNEIVGTIRFRLNVPFEFGNIGFEISPKSRNQGYGKKMLSELLKILKTEKLEKTQITVSQNNLPSQKIIEFNNGQLIKVTKDSDNKSNLNVYEIILK